MQFLSTSNNIRALLKILNSRSRQYRFRGFVGIVEVVVEAAAVVVHHNCRLQIAAVDIAAVDDTDDVEAQLELEQDGGMRNFAQDGSEAGLDTFGVEIVVLDKTFGFQVELDTLGQEDMCMYCSIAAADEDETVGVPGADDGTRGLCLLHSDVLCCQYFCFCHHGWQLLLLYLRLLPFDHYCHDQISFCPFLPVFLPRHH